MVSWLNQKCLVGVNVSIENGAAIYSQFQHYCETDCLCKGWSESAQVSVAKVGLLLTSHIPGQWPPPVYTPQANEDVIIGDLGLESIEMEFFQTALLRYNPLLPLRS